MVGGQSGGWRVGDCEGGSAAGAGGSVEAEGGDTVEPATQSVPKGVTSTVTTQLTLPQVSLPVESLQKILPQNLTVKGDLSGPAFARSLTRCGLATRATESTGRRA